MINSILIPYNNVKRLKYRYERLKSMSERLDFEFSKNVTPV